MKVNIFLTHCNFYLIVLKILAVYNRGRDILTHLLLESLSLCPVFCYINICYRTAELSLFYDVFTMFLFYDDDYWQDIPLFKESFKTSTFFLLNMVAIKVYIFSSRTYRVSQTWISWVFTYVCVFTSRISWVFTSRVLIICKNTAKMELNEVMTRWKPYLIFM